MSNPGSLAKNKVLIFGCVGLLGFCCIGSIVIGLFAWRATSKIAPANVACAGQPVPGSRPYLPHTAPTVASFEHNSQANWTFLGSVMPTSWPSADEPSQVSVVFCFEPEQRDLIETCTYEQGSLVRRYRFRRQVRAVAASTGVVLRSTDVVGHDPDPCASALSVTTRRGRTSTRDDEDEGDSVGAIEIEASFGDLFR